MANGKRGSSSGGRPFTIYHLPFTFVFVLLATLNSAGYRYGASDQAFYVPAVLKQLDPSLFPHDAALIASQARLTLVDETIAALARITGASVPVLFAALYVVSLALLMTGALLMANTLYRTRWAAFALLAALTLRHAIAKSGTNTLEGYFHPRQLAFAFGTLAIAAFLRGSLPLAALGVMAGALVHPTTALWFALWIGVAAVVTDRRVRQPALVLAACGALAVVWVVTAGPLKGRLEIMDPDWVATLATKDYLFPLAWPASVWLLNLAYIPVVIWVFRRRHAAGLTSPHERGLAAGCLALAALFFIALPLNVLHVQIAVQLQVARAFWMLDFLAVVYAVWALAEGTAASERRAAVVALVLLAGSCARGAYSRFVSFPERSMASIRLPDSDWRRVMEWARATDKASAWLADPLHAVRYGTSVRVAGERDVFVEAVKDTAIGMYDRPVAMRTRDRLEALGDFGSLTPARAREIADAYDLDYLVTEQRLDLPQAFGSGALRVYRLR